MDATWQEALDLELATARDLQYAGAGIDLYKAFDMLDRHLIYHIMEVGGVPPNIVDTYRRFFEQLQFRNRLGLGVGAPYHKHCAIAQGCALSMPLFALLLRPWILKMRGLGVIPRTLADDIRVQATQSGIMQDEESCTMMGRFKSACEHTFLFLDAMGAAASMGKSHLYASRADIRRKLKDMQWGALLPTDRGGRLEHWCSGAAPEPA